MSYKKRTLANTIDRANNAFPVLLLTGPRQVGKTTLLEHCSQNHRNVVTLDDLDERTLAKTDPALFLQKHTAPLLIDEVQYAPELFSYIKIIVDKDKRPGLFWLTGSQKFHLMRGVSETLAGRVAILDLLGLSQAEIANRAATSIPFLPTDAWINHAKLNIKSSINHSTLMSVYEAIWRGSFPNVLTHDIALRDIFYNSYVQTYIQRDVRALTQINNEIGFTRFLRAAAARTGQLINYANMARDVDVDIKTIKSWLSILEASGLIYLLKPYHNNITNRMIKTPKLYFLDTGLCAWLTQWSTAAALEAGAMSGAILETYILTEILKSYWHNGKTANFYFYRDRDQKEVDLLIEQDGKLYPIEFKKSATPTLHATSSFSALENLGQPIGSGAVICLRQTDVALSRSIMAIPVGYL